VKQHGLSADGETITLHRFDGGVEIQPPVDDSPIHRFAIIDVETTGLQPGVDRVIEFAIAEVDIQIENGIVVGYEGTRSWFEDPGIPIPEEITELTGICDADVKGQKLPEEEIRQAISQAKVVLAHNARFDRAFTSARFPWIEDPSMPGWSCSLQQIDWRGYGHRHANLENLAMDHGFFYHGHRASIDIEAVIKLLAMRPAPDQAPYFYDLVSDIRQRYFLLAADGTPFDAKDDLKARGFRWNPNQKHWYTSLPEPQLESELEWVRSLCDRHGRGRAITAQIPFSKRFDDSFEPAWKPG
jgi:DNA polymerase-3 subunit epsilon